MSAHSPQEHPGFASARPIWPVGLEGEMNRYAGFRAILRSDQCATLRVTASTSYRGFLNGSFIGCGPARAAHGYFRIDEWPLHKLGWLPTSDNLLAIEVSAQNINSYYTLDQPAFLQAEVVTEEGDVLAASGTSSSAFTAQLLDDHVQKVERYSVARTFSEVFNLHVDSTNWRTRVDFDGRPVACADLPPVKWLPRRVAYPDFAIHPIERCIANGTLRPLDNAGELKREETLTRVGPHLKGFPEDQLEVIPSLELQKLKCVPSPPDASKVLTSSRYEIYDLGSNLTGFVALDFACDQPVRIAVVFDEILDAAGDVSFNRMRCNNVIWVDAQTGRHQLESFEPYTMRYLKLMCLDGRCHIDRIALRRYEHPPLLNLSFRSDDQRLNRIFDAAVSTFRQNAIDIFMDCPSRERAGWLCDSFYTARVARDLTGSTTIEKNFLENFLLPERFEHLPDGMIAMNYPADHPNGKFIPNWALWFVLQVEEYLARSGDRGMIEAMRQRVAGIFRYFDHFRNSDGLLERLDSWIFVEWSKANDFVHDVNFPTNMLYAAALDAGARLYDRDDWADAAQRIRQTIREQSFDGEFFVDNAARRHGRLERTRNRSEVCQYYAFYFDVASPLTQPTLWNMLMHDFGPHRAATRAFPEVHPANMLMGYMMRLELLGRYATSRQLCDETVGYFLPMAELTGTLWEHARPTESCNHGFGSHVAHLLLRYATEKR